MGLPWRIAATNDMNGDGNADIIWHNGTTGETQVWLLAGFQIIRRVTVFAENGSPILIGLPWSIVGSNDFGDTKSPDIVWHNAITGETQVWTMNLPRIGSRVTVRGETGSPALVGAPFRIAGTVSIDSLPAINGLPPPTSIPGVVPPPAAPGSATATVIQILNVRSGPGSQFAVIGVLNAGTEVRISLCQAGWCRLAQPVAGQVGWVAQQYLVIAGPPGGPQAGAPAG